MFSLSHMVQDTFIIYAKRLKKNADFCLFYLLLFRELFI